MSSETQTTIVIAHRLSTIKNADVIAVIDGGKVRETGTHDELMSKPNGHYRRLQAFQNLEEAESESLKAPIAKSYGDMKDTSKALEDGELDGDGVEKKEDVDKVAEKANAQRARLLARGDRKYFVIGSIGAVGAGIIFPAWGVRVCHIARLCLPDVIITLMMLFFCTLCLTRSCSRS